MFHCLVATFGTNLLKGHALNNVSQCIFCEKEGLNFTMGPKLGYALFVLFANNIQGCGNY